MGSSEEERAESSMVVSQAPTDGASNHLNRIKNWIVWGFVIALILALPMIYQLAKYVLATTAG
jgi:hypothetical protein